MSQASVFHADRGLIDSREIHELAMSSHSYVNQAIWWVRLAKALDVLAEDILCTNISSLRQEFARRSPHLGDLAADLDAMADEAQRAIEATRKHVTMVAGERGEALLVRDSVKWLLKRVQLMNYLIEDLSFGECHPRTAQGNGRLRSLPME